MWVSMPGFPLHHHDIVQQEMPGLAFHLIGQYHDGAMDKDNLKGHWFCYYS